MAKTNRIIQAKESLYMKENTPTPSVETEDNRESVDTKAETESGKKFKEIVCPKVPTSYFKRAKRQRTK
ncbi:hypothetical protein [Providencia sneebia]|uniref:Uncharacterized protein n=1 Tax=Providencia sneebia DSM 19967 TaxID=1141660 RepID=K8WA65_9GAMM|nr:hypothetical protein [Providencia sneebia]EKT57548.1 hypothetical protein OO7_09195 [Providencia sneebia DSM 19967]